MVVLGGGLFLMSEVPLYSQAGLTELESLDRRRQSSEVWLSARLQQAQGCIPSMSNVSCRGTPVVAADAWLHPGSRPCPNVDIIKLCPPDAGPS